LVPDEEVAADDRDALDQRQAGDGDLDDTGEDARRQRLPVRIPAMLRG
jgi:hypothetical protein